MWPIIKKYAKYMIILLLGIGAIALWVMVSSWLKKRGQGGDGLTPGTETLKDVIVEIGAKMTDADKQAVVEIAAARTKESETKVKLSKVVKIENKVERRKQLADLYKEVSE